MKKIDLKDWVIIILGCVILFMLLTKKTLPINDDSKAKIEQLKVLNDSLVEANAFINIEIGEWNALYNRLELEAKETEKKLAKSQQEIDLLKSKRATIAAETTKLTADEVSNVFNEYLKEKK